MKRAMDPQVLVKIIVTLGTLIVFLFIIPGFREALAQTGSKTSCNWSFLVGKITSLDPSAVPIDCQTTKLRIGPNELKPYMNIAKRRVDKYHKSAGYRDVASVYPESTQGYQRWALDKIVADQMVKCWDKTWHGKLNPAEMVKLFKIDTMCVLCARIDFNPDLPASLKGEDLNLVPWMKANAYYGKTYYDYIVRDMEFKETKNEKNWADTLYYDIDSRSAVVYWYTEPDTAAKIAKLFDDFIGSPIQGSMKFVGLGVKERTTRLYLWHYEDLTKPVQEGGLACEKIIG